VGNVRYCTESINALEFGHVPSNSRRMARYFFHLHDHGIVYRDEEGAEFADDDAAREEALLSARELLGVSSLTVRQWLGRSYEVSDETGRLVAVLPFAEAIDVAS